MRRLPTPRRRRRSTSTSSRAICLPPVACERNWEDRSPYPRIAFVTGLSTLAALQSFPRLAGRAAHSETDARALQEECSQPATGHRPTGHPVVIEVDGEPMGHLWLAERRRARCNISYVGLARIGLVLVLALTVVATSDAA